MERLRAASEAEPLPFTRMWSLAAALRDEGMSQAQLRELFEAFVASCDDSVREAAPPAAQAAVSASATAQTAQTAVVDAALDVLDYIVGWTSAGNSLRLFAPPSPRKCTRCDDPRGLASPEHGPAAAPSCEAGLCILLHRNGASEWRWFDSAWSRHGELVLPSHAAAADGTKEAVEAEEAEEAEEDEDEDEDKDYEFGHCEFAWPGGGAPLRLRLLSHRQRFAARVWPAAELLSRHLHAHPQLVRGRAVLELGAGAALPSLCAALLGAAALLVTDFPDARMVENMTRNLDANLPHALRGCARVCGYSWSQSPEVLLSQLRELQQRAAPAETEPEPEATPTAAAAEAAARFDCVLMSDLLYECEHEALLSATAACLGARAHARALLTFQPHDPVQLGKQLRFFELAPSYGLRPNLLRVEAVPKMFDDDDEGVDQEEQEPENDPDAASSLTAPPHEGVPPTVLCRRAYLYELIPQSVS